MVLGVLDTPLLLLIGGKSRDGRRLKLPLLLYFMLVQIYLVWHLKTFPVEDKQKEVRWLLIEPKKNEVEGIILNEEQRVLSHRCRCSNSPLIHSLMHGSTIMEHMASPIFEHLRHNISKVVLIKSCWFHSPVCSSALIWPSLCLLLQISSSPLPSSSLLNWTFPRLHRGQSLPHGLPTPQWCNVVVAQPVAPFVFADALHY